MHIFGDLVDACFPAACIQLHLLRKKLSAHRLPSAKVTLGICVDFSSRRAFAEFPQPFPVSHDERRHRLNRLRSFFQLLLDSVDLREAATKFLSEANPLLVCPTLEWIACSGTHAASSGGVLG